MQNLDLELRWKQDWAKRFFREYRGYEENTLPYCNDKNRDIRFDIERKVNALHDIPLGRVVSTLKRYIKVKDIEYDSIVMTNLHNYLFESEFTFPPVYFSVFKGDGAIHLIVHVDDDKNCSIALPEKDPGISKEKTRLLLPGCGYGYVSYTVFDKKWNYRITKIVINPD